MKHKRSIFLSITFLLFLALPQFGILFNLDSEREELQNRALNSLPKMNMKSLLSASFGKELNDYIWDHLPLRSRLLQADHWIDYHIFNDSPIPDKVIMGRDQWLFFYPSVMDYPQKSAQQVETFVALARKVTELQRRIGTEIIIIPSPAKASIYPEFLPDYHQKEYVKHASIFHERLEAAASDVKSLLLLWAPFRNEKERLLRSKQTNPSITWGTHYLFRPRDRHYSWETSIFQAKKIIDKIAPGRWQDNIYDDYFTQYKYEKSEMESRFMKIHLPELYTTLLTKKYLEAFSITQKIYPVEMTNRSKVTFTTGINPIIKPLTKRVVVIHDSFFDKSMFLMAPYFKESVYMHWRLSDNFPLFMKTVKKADILIIQSVEGRWYWGFQVLMRILRELDKTA